MSWGLAFDILLVAVAALSQSITGYLGWRVTVDGGAPVSKKKRYEILFTACVVLGVLATVGIAYRGGNIGKDLNEIKRAQHEQGKELHQIEENQKQHPNITVSVPSVPPPPKQRATMTLSRNTGDDGIQIIHDPQYPQYGWLVNVSCKNTGTIVTAKKVACAEYTERIPANGGIPAKLTLQQHWNEFSKKLGAAHHPQYVDLDPGKNTWGSVGLHMLEVDPDLNSGNKVIMVAGAIFYSDEAGPHKKEFCEWAQPPFNPANPTWHFCEIGHNHEVY
jgi:hypothetical protein